MNTPMVSMPAIFQIETTSVCNLKCIMCPHPRMMAERLRPAKHMKLDLFKTIIERDAIATERIGLHILGEPLLHRDIIEMVKFTAEHHIAPEFATNGTIMDEALAKGLMTAGLDTIWFSFDGGTKETYEQIRLGATWERVIFNIGVFLGVKARLNADTQVHIQMVLQPENSQEESRFYEFWQDMQGVDYVTVKFLDSWAGTMLDDVVTPPQIVRHPCAEPFNRVAVLQNGDVVPCCRDWQGMYVYGNLRSQSLYDIWHDEKAELLRMEHRLGHYMSEPCKSCKEWDIPMDRRVSVNENAAIWSGRQPKRV